MFLNDIKYNNLRYTRLRTNYDTKYNKYKIKAYRLFKGII